MEVGLPLCDRRQNTGKRRKGRGVAAVSYCGKM